LLKKTAFLFPGQGSQYVGMGQDIADAFPSAKKIFEQVDEICGFAISKLCFEGPMDELTLTVNLQPAVSAVNLACLAAVAESGISPDMTAGHSLGEYSALVCAGVITVEDALRLVNKRGELMHREAMANPGAMAAIIGMDINKVNHVVEMAKDDDILAVANHNSSEQIVISGEKKPVSRAMKIAKEKRARAVPLKVSGAWHCQLIDGAVSEFRDFIKTVSFRQPELPVIFNVTANSETDPERIQDIMARQLVSPVKWYDIIIRMIQDGVNVFVEVGPKKVLSGLLKKIIPQDQDIRVLNVGTLEELRTLTI